MDDKSIYIYTYINMIYKYVFIYISSMYPQNLFAFISDAAEFGWTILCRCNVQNEENLGQL